MRRLIMTGRLFALAYVGALILGAIVVELVAPSNVRRRRDFGDPRGRWHA